MYLVLVEIYRYEYQEPLAVLVHVHVKQLTSNLSCITYYIHV